MLQSQSSAPLDVQPEYEQQHRCGNRRAQQEIRRRKASTSGDVVHGPELSARLLAGSKRRRNGAAVQIIGEV